MLIDKLQQSTLFNQLSITELEQISRFCTLVELNDGQMLLYENDNQNNDLFILISGSLEIVSNNSEDLSNEVAISVHEKDVFGEIGWLTGEKRTASARTHGYVEVIKIHGQSLNQYIEAHPESGCKILKSVSLMLADRIKQSNTLVKQILWNHHL